MPQAITTRITTRTTGRTARAALATTALLGAMGAAQAQFIEGPGPLPDTGGKDQGVVGLDLRLGQHKDGIQPGQDDHRFRLAPSLGYYSASGWYASTQRGLGYNASSSPNLQYGPQLTLDPGRRQHDEARLEGMGDIKRRAEVGGFLNYSPQANLWLTSSLRAGAGNDHNGLRLDLGATYDTALAPGLKLRLGAGTTLANQAYRQTYFGVNAEQAAATGYAAYKPGAGLVDVNASATLAYQVTPKVTVTAGITARHLLDGAANSPVVNHTSGAQGKLALNYGF